MCLGRIFFDFPKTRGLHLSPIPRVGGIGVIASVSLLSGFWMKSDFITIIAALGLLLAAMSMLDDLRSLPALLRLLVHAACATLIVLLWVNAFGLQAGRGSDSIRLLMSPFWACVIGVAIIWMTNLYNFMDGADGLAGGMSVVGFGTYAAAAALLPNSDGSLGFFSIAIAGAAAGFLVCNFPPARVFLGDAGSIPLGFLAITLGIHGNIIGLWPWWFGALVFSPFIVDATTTLLRRIAQGHKPWIAHRDHYYQRLILGGWSHQKTALVYYCVILASAGSALCAIADPGSSLMLIAWVITYGLLLLLTERYLHQKKNNKIKE